MNRLGFQWNAGVDPSILVVVNAGFTPRRVTPVADVAPAEGLLLLFIVPAQHF